MSKVQVFEVFAEEVRKALKENGIEPSFGVFRPPAVIQSYARMEMNVPTGGWYAGQKGKRLKVQSVQYYINFTPAKITVGIWDIEFGHFYYEDPMCFEKVVEWAIDGCTTTPK